MSSSSADRDPLELLAEEFVARYRAGEQPTISEYVARYPECAEQIRDLFPTLLEIEQLKPREGDATGDFVPARTASASIPLQIGEFRILREVGRGGMGVVYEAIQGSLGRHVALKVLGGGTVVDPRRLERFRREAKAAAKLHHTNIVPVFGTGEADGLYYYAMQYIAGQGLDQVLAELRRLRERGSSGSVTPVVLPAATIALSQAEAAAHSLWTGRFALASPLAQLPAPRSGETDTGTGLSNPSDSVITASIGRHYWEGVARLGVQAASALAHAHAQGVLHRDIKPSNLLLDPQGTLWVTDFGLAKMAEEDNLTAAGDIVGTLRYMAPERFEGRCDARADLYALGLTLYELLTMRSAFDETAREKLILQVTQGHPPRPALLNPEVPRDLETIVLRAMAREPEARYASAEEMAEDLQCFVEDRPIRARRASLSERLWRWGRRNPLVASLTAALLLVLVGATIASSIAALSFHDLAEKERAARTSAEQKEQQIAADLDRLNRANGLFESGLRHAVRKDWARALTDYTEATTLRPDNSQVWSDRGVLYLRLGLAEEAAADFNQLFRVRLPNEPAWWSFHGILRLHVGDRNGYQAVSRGVWQHFPAPNSPEVVRALTQIATLTPEGSADPARLVRLVQEVAERFPTEDFSAQQVAALHRAGSHREVATLTAPVDAARTRALRITDLCFRAMSLAQLGEKEAAQASLEAARDKLDATASILSLQSFGPEPAERYVGSYPPAEKQETLCDWVVDTLLFREAAQVVGGNSEDHPLPLFLRARGCAALDRWQEADEATTRALRFCLGDDKHLRIPAVALIEQARLAALRGRWAEVETALDRATKMAPPAYPVLEQGIKLYTAQGRDAEARKYLDQALVRAPNDLELRLERSRALMRLADWPGAAADLVAILNDQRWQPRFSKKGFGGSFGGGFFDSYFPSRHMDTLAPVSLPDPRKQVREEIVRHEELYRLVNKQRPQDGELHLERGRFLLKNNRWQEAGQHYVRWVEQNPPGQSPEVQLGQIAETVAPYDVVFDTLIQRWPSNTALWRARSAWLLRKGEVDKAADAVVATLPRPGAPDPSLENAFLVILESDKLFQAVATRRPEDVNLWMARFQQQAMKQQWDEAETAARHAAKLQPDNVMLLRRLAQTLRGGSRWESATAYYLQAQKRSPNDASLDMELFHLYSQRKQWDEAARTLASALTHASLPPKPGDPPSPSVAMIYSQINQKEVLEELTKRRPNDAQLWLNYGHFFASNNQMEKALPALARGAQLARNDSRAWSEVARVYLRFSKWEEAGAAIGQAFRHVGPPGKPGMNHEGFMQSFSYVSPEQCNKLIEHCPQEGALWLLRGHRLATRREWKPALADLTRATELIPKSAEAWLELGRAQATMAQVAAGVVALPDWEQAASAFSRVLDLHPPVSIDTFAPPEEIPVRRVYFEIIVRSFGRPNTQGPDCSGFFKAVAALRPKDAALWQEYYRFLKSSQPAPQNARAEIRRALEEMVKRAPGEPQTWLERAAFLVSINEFDQASSDCLAAAKLLPQTFTWNPDLYKNPAYRAHNRLYDMVSTAPRIFELFTARRKDDPYPWFFRANRRPSEDVAGYLADLERAVTSRPEDTFFRNVRRSGFLAVGQWEKAAELFAAELKEKEPEAGAFLWIEAASAFAATGQTERYKAWCRRMEEVWQTPRDPQPRQSLAWAALLLPDSGIKPDKLLAFAQDAQKANPTPPWNTFTVALAHSRRGEHATAVTLVRDYLKATAATNHPIQDQVLLKLLLALALARDGKPNEASPVFQTACMQMDETLGLGEKRRRLGPGHAWAGAFALRREVEALLNAKTPKKDQP